MTSYEELLRQHALHRTALQKIEVKLRKEIEGLRSMSISTASVQERGRRIADIHGRLLKSDKELSDFGNQLTQTNMSILQQRKEWEDYQHRLESTIREKQESIRATEANRSTTETQLRRTRNDLRDEENKLAELTDKNEELGKAQDVAVFAGFLYSMGTAALSPAALTAGSLAAGHFAAAGILEAIKASRERIDDLRESVAHLENRKNNFEGERQAAEVSLSNMIQEESRARESLRQMQEQQNMLDGCFRDVDAWRRQLNNWLSLLGEIKPHTGNVARHLDRPMLQRILARYDERMPQILSSQRASIAPAFTHHGALQ